MQESPHRLLIPTQNVVLSVPHKNVNEHFVKKVNIRSYSSQVGWKAVEGKLHCLCTHLSAFGGNIFVAPNPIDFEKVWTEFERIGDTGNFLVLSTVCVIFGIYIVGLVFARRADIRDLQKVSIILLPIIDLIALNDLRLCKLCIIVVCTLPCISCTVQLLAGVML